MRFTISSPKPINATYKDAETGIIQYKVRSPIKVHEVISTITRRIDTDIPRRNSGSESDHSSSSATTSARFGHLAEIAWYIRKPSLMRFGGKEIDPETFFTKPEGVPWYGYPSRIFTAQDGKEYKWVGSYQYSRLKLNDGSDTLVAEYGCKSVGLLSKKRDPYLEIFPPYEHMVDEIMVTFIFVERLRRSRQDGNTVL
ncbi:hypothetical protein FB45DRAFT_825990 [Roridomyces roridus]|uniref:DUF6593 domain-containing protein n=1 Tax=Roridomyces roridus TaxID=1738132 RepID=A0AAD7C8G6_9AGAR|nr:hypothetical protein FB45DRAFT_825990 [Roridomyces roridus]